MNKKGIFFTAMTIVVLTLFLIGYTFYSSIKERKSIQKRIETMNSFVVSMEKDLQRQLYVSGYRMTFVIAAHIIRENNYIDNSEIRFDELFFNATLYGSHENAIDIIMNGFSYDGITESSQDYLSKNNLNISFQNSVFEVKHADPWNLQFTLTSDIYINDISGLASWNKTKTITALVPIEGFEDPFYFVGLGGISANIIERSPFPEINSSNVIQHFNGTHSYYINNSRSPSFLNKLEGNFSSHEFGIESLVHTPSLPNPEIGKSNVDFKYFSQGNWPGDPRNPPWLYLDANDCAVYDVC